MSLTTVAPLIRHAPGLVVSASAEGSTTAVALRGEVDFATVPVLQDVLDRVIADHAGPVVVDLAETRFIDTASVRALARASRELEQQGRRLSIRGPSRMAIRILELFGLSHLILADGNDHR